MPDGAVTTTATATGDLDRGSLMVEAVYLMPILLLFLFAGLQFGLWHDARATCQGAAAAGAAAAAGMTAAGGSGAAAAQAFLAAQPDSSVLGPTVTESATPVMVTVTCAGTSLALLPLPGVPLSVTASASAPKERWVSP